MAAKSGENWNFPPRDKILLYYHEGQKFARNCSISCHFRDIFNVLFSTKIQDGRQKWQKLKFFPCAQDTLELPCRSKISLKLLYLLPFEIFSMFHFPLKSKMAAKSGKNWIFPLHIGYSCTSLWIKNSLEIALSLTVFEIFVIFHIFTKSNNKVAITYLFIEQQVWNLNMLQFIKNSIRDAHSPQPGEIVFNTMRYRSSETVQRSGYFQSSVSYIKVKMMFK